MVYKASQYAQRVYAPRLAELKQGRDTILVPGTMGSELYDLDEADEVWLDGGVWHEIDDLEFGSLPPDGGRDGGSQIILARNTVQPPVVAHPYAEFFAQFTNGSGPRAVAFPFDWRDNILDVEVTRFRSFLGALLPGGSHHVAGKQYNLVAHSLGCCVVALTLGATEHLYDDLIAKVVMVAPPFRGVLKMLRVIEDGTGSPIDFLIKNSTLRRSAATMPSLFQMHVAPPGDWLASVPDGSGGQILLQHPLRRTDPNLEIDLRKPGAYTNTERPDLRSTVLAAGTKFYPEMKKRLATAATRYADRMHVVVGVHGKTPCLAQRDPGGEWRLQKDDHTDPYLVANGDGVVLFQSSYVPQLPLDQHWVYVPLDDQGRVRKRRNVHGDLLDLSEVIADVGRLIDDLGDPGYLLPASDVLPFIDWKLEQAGAQTPHWFTNLDYFERERARHSPEGRDHPRYLSLRGADATLFRETREAALRTIGRVYAGRDRVNPQEVLEQEATRSLPSNLPGNANRTEFLYEHLRTLVIPVLFG